MVSGEQVKKLQFAGKGPMLKKKRALHEGIKFDQGKPAFDLLPFDALIAVAEVSEFGKKKYAARNWEKGMAWGRLVGASGRHLGAWMMGQDTDPESGLHHLAHFAWCALSLLALVKRGKGIDDRKPLE